MIVSVEVNDVVYPPWPDNWDGFRLSQFRATLDAFTQDEWLAIAENPFGKPGYANMARVHPVKDEIFDIRVLDPDPGIRVFGGFAAKDTFLALTWDYRENIDDWAYEIDRCKDAWASLFHPSLPHHGATLDDYLSSNFYAV
jgi:hypothetical protein